MRKYEQIKSIAIGSTSDHKIGATNLACKRLGLDKVVICPTKTFSGQNEQPVGFEQTYNGAFERAMQARRTFLGCNVAIGIESGIICFPTINGQMAMDIAVVVIIDRNYLSIVTTSVGIRFPTECVEIAREHGFKTTTVGSIIAEVLPGRGNGTDPHSILTDGRVTRVATLVDAIEKALIQI